MQAWPKKRGLPDDPYAQETIGRFIMAQYMAKRAAPEQIAIAMEATKNSGLYPRDLLTKAMLAGFLDLELEDGTVLERPPLTWEVPVFKGAAVWKSGTFTIPANSSVTPTFDQIELNPVGLFDPGLPDRFTIPAGITVVDVHAFLRQQNSLNNAFQLAIHKFPGPQAYARFNQVANLNKALGVHTGPVAVNTGDYFTITVFASTSTLVAAGQPDARFSITVLG